MVEGERKEIYFLSPLPLPFLPSPTHPYPLQFENPRWWLTTLINKINPLPTHQTRLKPTRRHISHDLSGEIIFYHSTFCFQLVSLAQRRRPPPDFDLIEDGFVLTEGESEERRITKRIINRKSKRVVQPLPVLSEEEFVLRCREEAYNMLLGVRKKYCFFYDKYANLE